MNSVLPGQNMLWNKHIVLFHGCFHPTLSCYKLVTGLQPMAFPTQIFSSDHRCFLKCYSLRWLKPWATFVKFLNNR